MSMAPSPSLGFDSPRAGQALHYCLPMRHGAGPDGTTVKPVLALSALWSLDDTLLRGYNKLKGQFSFLAQE